MANFQLCTFIVGVLIYTVSADCSAGWQRLTDSCFLFSTDSHDWFKAQNSCLAQDARLAEPRDKVTTDKLIELALKINGARNINFWLGGHDDIIDGDWMWASTESTIEYTRWHPRQPDNKLNEDCLEMYHSYRYEWNDNHCETHNHYICEKEYENVDIIG